MQNQCAVHARASRVSTNGDSTSSDRIGDNTNADISASATKTCQVTFGCRASENTKKADRSYNQTMAPIEAGNLKRREE